MSKIHAYIKKEESFKHDLDEYMEDEDMAQDVLDVMKGKRGRWGKQ